MVRTSLALSTVNRWRAVTRPSTLELIQKRSQSLACHLSSLTHEWVEDRMEEIPSSSPGELFVIVISCLKDGEREREREQTKARLINGEL